MAHHLTLAYFPLALVGLLACASKPEPSPEPSPPSAPTPAQAALPGPQQGPHPGHSAEAADLAPTPAPAPGARVFFAEPTEGATITGTIEDGLISVKLKMGAEGIAIEPAGEIKAGSGHHHVIIDGAALALGTVVPKDPQHLHFGQGQTAATVMLAPGEHALTLQLADGAHRSYGEALSATIKITTAGTGTVKAEPAPATPTKAR